LEGLLIEGVLGAGVGLVLGLTGAGGAILSVPLLSFFLDLTVAQAAPIGLLAVFLSAGVGAILGLRAQILRYKAALLIAVSGLILSPIGIWLAQQLPNWPLVIIFVLILLWVARNMWQQAQKEILGIEPALGPPCQLDQDIGKLIWTAPCARALSLSGMCAGFFSGLLGVGGGFIIVPALNRYTDLPMKSIVATSLGVLTLVSGGGVLFSNIYGVMDWAIAMPFALASMVGLLIGRQIAWRLPAPQLKKAFAILATGIALLMLSRLGQ
jgi:uncharacterized membrane protein YfcA